MSIDQTVSVSCELQGTIVGLFVSVDDDVRAGQVVALVERFGAAADSAS